MAAGLTQVQYVRDNFGLDGTGQIVGVSDSGLDNSVVCNNNGACNANNPGLHVDFLPRVNAIIDRSGDGPEDRFNSGHGTHVAGTAIGDGDAGAAFGRRISGVAPGASTRASYFSLYILEVLKFSTSISRFSRSIEMTLLCMRTSMLNLSLNSSGVAIIRFSSSVMMSPT